MHGFRVRGLTGDDQRVWRQLFDGYAAFYKLEMDDATAQRVWDWLLDPDHPLEGLLVERADGSVVAMGHVRSCPRTLSGCDLGFLDDMFVAPEARGSGAADALFRELERLARARGWPAVRWITQHFNYRGRSFYDRYTGGPTDFIMYQQNFD